MNAASYEDIGDVVLPISGPKHPATLLIASKLLPVLEKRMLVKNLSLNLYIGYLLKNFLSLNRDASFPFSPHLRTRYQDHDQDLIMVNFRVDPEFWHALKLFARSRGISICMLFAYLLAMESRRNERAITPKRVRHRHGEIFLIYYEERMDIQINQNQKITQLATGPPC